MAKVKFSWAGVPMLKRIGQNIPEPHTLAALLPGELRVPDASGSKKASA
jgi:hypothetical protein